MPSPVPPTVLIVGSGAMACLFAARLAASGAQVTLLGSWRAGLQALRDHGVRLVEPDGRQVAYPVRATAKPSECSGAQTALVLVKSWQTRQAARQLVDCLDPGGLALTLQNGLGNHEILAAELGADRAALGVTTLGANLIGPGQVRAGGEGEIVLREHPRLEPAANLLREAGFAVDTTPDASALLWGKLVINAAINPLTALLQVPNGELLARPAARELLGAIAREAADVAAGQGIALPYPDPVLAAEAVAKRTAANRSSMLQDVSRGAPTEIDAICGAIVRAGERSGVPTPVNRALWRLIQARVGAERAAIASLETTSA